MTNSKKSLIHTISLVVFCFSLVLLAVFLCGVYNYYLKYKIRNDGKIVEATYVSVIATPGQDITTHWSLVYEYVDSDGTIYSDWIYRYSNKEKAEELIGEKVSIIIDGKGNSVLIGSLKYDHTNVVFSFISLAVAITSLVFMIKYKKFSKSSKRKSPTSVQDNNQKLDN